MTQPTTTNTSSVLDRIVRVSVYNTAIDGYEVREMPFRDAVKARYAYPNEAEVELLRQEGIIAPTKEEADRLDSTITVRVYDWDADATDTVRMTLRQAILERRVYPTAREAELLRAEGHTNVKTKEEEEKEKAEAKAKAETKTEVKISNIKRVRIWKSPDKKEYRIYVSTRDGREGCLYLTGNPWHKKGSIDGNLTAEEWSEARRLSVWDNAWHAIEL